MSENEPASVVMTRDRSEVHSAVYPHVFVEDSGDCPASVTVVGGSQLRRSIQPFFSRKDGCSLSGWRVPAGELELLVACGSRELRVSYKDGCVVHVSTGGNHASQSNQNHPVESPKP